MRNRAPVATTEPKTDRFLIGIVAGILLLLVVAVISLFALRQPAPLLPEGTPGGAVQRFQLALEARDYNAAYVYLSDNIPDKPSLESFVSFHNSQAAVDRPNRRLRIQDETVMGNSATVTVLVTETQSGVFGGDYNYTEIFTLARDNGAWRIMELPYLYRPFPTR